MGEFETIHTSFAEQVRSGAISPEDARKIQRDLTGKTVGRGKEESIIIKMDNGTEHNFQNAAEVLDWVGNTGALIYRETGEKAYGQPVDEILESTGK